MIKAVIFDVDGVLLDSFEANFKFFQGLFGKCGYRPPTREEYKLLFHMNLMDSIKIVTKLDDEEEIKKIWELGRSRETGYDLSLLKTPRGASEVIKKLAKEYLLGIVTSRIEESIYESPKLAKLKNNFKISVAYQHTTNHKPHPEPLLFAAEKMGVKPKECVYVGDLESDIVAARAAGMKIIIYSKDKFPLADAYTSSFIKIPDLIKSLSKK